MMKPPLQVMLANPRGFCAGVDRAIQIVEKALEKFGPPIYVRHEIVHNRYVVASLEAKGAIFVLELDQVPDDACVIFSAHGVPKSVPREAERRQLIYFDATCPLVDKVHHEAQHLYKKGYRIILIGHRGHPEVVGTIGQIPEEGAVILVESVDDAQKLTIDPAAKLAFVTQTTLSLDETRDIVAVLRSRYPHILAPKKEDICYATTNRQQAVKQMAPLVDRMVVIGSPNSSNSVRLVEVSRAHGCAESRLYDSAADIDWQWMGEARSLGLTAGASAPEALVEEVLQACAARFDVSVSQITLGQENVYFNLPKALDL